MTAAVITRITPGDGCVLHSSLEGFGLPSADTSDWSGLHLSVILSVRF